MIYILNPAQVVCKEFLKLCTWFVTLRPLLRRAKNLRLLRSRSVQHSCWEVPNAAQLTTLAHGCSVGASLSSFDGFDGLACMTLVQPPCPLVTVNIGLCFEVTCLWSTPSFAPPRLVSRPEFFGPPEFVSDDGLMPSRGYAVSDVQLLRTSLSLAFCLPCSASTKCQPGDTGKGPQLSCIRSYVGYTIVHATQTS